MRLPDLHRRLLSDVLECGNTYVLVLAGGDAIQAHDLASRLSQDLDLATDAAADMTEIVQALVSGLEARGWAVGVVEIAPRTARLIATDPVIGAQCEVDILKEIFHKPPTRTEAGPTLSRDDAVGLKVRALHDRGFPRDVIVSSAAEICTRPENSNGSAPSTTRSSTSKSSTVGSRRSTSPPTASSPPRGRARTRSPSFGSGSSSGWTTSYCGSPSRMTTTRTEALPGSRLPRLRRRPGTRRGGAGAVLPRSWSCDPERCRAAGLGEDTVFVSKPELARMMIERFLDAGHQAGWVTGDGLRRQPKAAGCPEGTWPALCACGGLLGRSAHRRGHVPRRRPGEEGA